MSIRLLVIDCEGQGLDLCLRAMACGHKVRLFCRQNKDGSRCEVGDGLVKRIPHWEDSMEWADLIFLTDNTYYIHALEHYRRKGYPIFGASIDAAEWEQDRITGTEMFDRAGIKTIPQTKFKNYDEAITYVQKTGQAYCSKPVGDGDKALSYVAKTPKELLFMLNKWKKTNAYRGEFVLQELREGVEVAVGGWFGLGGFSKWFNENWEFKKLFNDDLGVSTGEQGTVMHYTRDSTLAQKVLCPLEDMLHGLNYTGYIDVNCIVDKSGTPWPLEFTMRPGWPHFHICQQLHKGDPIEWMLDSINGEDTLQVSTNIATGVVISLPDYPYCTKLMKEYSGYPLFDITKDCIPDGISPVWIKQGPDKDLVTTGPYVAIVSGTGSTIEKACERAYKCIDEYIYIPCSPQYRSDIGCKLEDQLPKLQKNGYCLDVEYC